MVKFIFIHIFQTLFRLQNLFYTYYRNTSIKYKIYSDYNPKNQKSKKENENENKKIANKTALYTANPFHDPLASTSNGQEKPSIFNYDGEEEYVRESTRLLLLRPLSLSLSLPHNSLYSPLDPNPNLSSPRRNSSPAYSPSPVSSPTTSYLRTASRTGRPNVDASCPPPWALRGTSGRVSLGEVLRVRRSKRLRFVFLFLF